MIIEQLFVMTAATGLAATLAGVVGANIYDVQEVKKQRQFARHPHARQYRQRPLVSVIVEAQDDETVIERCLRSLGGSSYRKLEIIVIDNASRDHTRRLIRQFQAAHPKRSIRLVARRTAGGGRAIIAANARKYTRGERILWLNAGHTVDKAAIGNAVSHCNIEPDVDIVMLDRRVVSAFNTIGLFQQYYELLHYRFKKLSSISSSVSEQTDEPALYRRAMLLSPQSRNSQPVRSYYASDALVSSTPLSSFYGLIRQQYSSQLHSLRTLWRQRLLWNRQNGLSRFVNWASLPLTLCTIVVSLFVPLLISYFIYMAISLHEPAFFILSLVSVGVLVLFAIWGDEQLRVAQKASYSLLLPITYGLFYILSFVQVFVVLRAILSPKQLLAD